jgi:hypothetical protein
MTNQHETHESADNGHTDNGSESTNSDTSNTVGHLFRRYALAVSIIAVGEFYGKYVGVLTAVLGIGVLIVYHLQADYGTGDDADHSEQTRE